MLRLWLFVCLQVLVVAGAVFSSPHFVPSVYHPASRLSKRSEQRPLVQVGPHSLPDGPAPVHRLHWFRVVGFHHDDSVAFEMALHVYVGILPPNLQPPGPEVQLNARTARLFGPPETLRWQLLAPGARGNLNPIVPMGPGIPLELLAKVRVIETIFPELDVPERTTAFRYLHSFRYPRAFRPRSPPREQHPQTPRMEGRETTSPPPMMPSINLLPPSSPLRLHSPRQEILDLPRSLSPMVDGRPPGLLSVHRLPETGVAAERARGTPAMPNLVQLRLNNLARPRDLDRPGNGEPMNVEDTPRGGERRRRRRTGTEDGPGGSASGPGQS